MAKLPDADQAVISDAKLIDYLLSPTHPVGSAKAAFFGDLGFLRIRWTVLRDALLRHAFTGDAVALPPDQFGQKFLVRGILQGPARVAVCVSVWIVRPGDPRPHFVTAYPWHHDDLPRT